MRHIGAGVVFCLVALLTLLLVPSSVPAQKPPDSPKPPRFAVGDRVMAARDGRWRFAEVLEALPGKYRVRFIGFATAAVQVVDSRLVGPLDPELAGEPIEESPALPPRATTPPAAGNALPGARLDGLYLRSDLLPLLNGRARGLIPEGGFLLFFPDGRLYAGFPAGGALDMFSAARALITDPRRCGAYTVSDGRISLQWPELRREMDSRFLRRGRHDLLLGRFTYHRLSGWPPGSRLDGPYLWDRALFPAGPLRAAAARLTFRRDGTFEVGIPGISRKTGEALGPDPYERGIYTLAGSTLTLIYYGGRRTRHTACFLAERTVDRSRPDVMVVDGGVFPRQRPPAGVPGIGQGY